MKLGINSILALQNWLINSQLEFLNLSDNALTDYAMHAIKSIISNTQLKMLSLASNMISG